MSPRIITIDGPAGAGKTTVSRMLSQRLGCVYVDTGALYRAVAYEILHRNIDWENEEVLELFLKDLDLCFTMEKDGLVLRSSGRDITGCIRTPQISMLASASSANPRVRAALLDIQHSIAGTTDAVFEGRDMGTVVFPHADHKFFLFADLKVRAKRRFDEMPAGTKELDRVQEEMALRDDKDSTRVEAPLKPALDAVKIDSTRLTLEQVVEKIVEIIEKA
jgi:cytidylate kinase